MLASMIKSSQVFSGQKNSGGLKVVICWANLGIEYCNLCYFDNF